jgi:hypothetical protein
MKITRLPLLTNCSVVRPEGPAMSRVPFEKNKFEAKIQIKPIKADIANDHNDDIQTNQTDLKFHPIKTNAR